MAADRDSTNRRCSMRCAHLAQSFAGRENGLDGLISQYVVHVNILDHLSELEGVWLATLTLGPIWTDPTEEENFETARHNNVLRGLSH